MKTLLFGLATAAACASSPQEAHYPLCDRDGAPACGNIGQVGRSAARAAASHAAQHAIVSAANAVNETVLRVAPQLTRVLIGASREVLTSSTPFQRPLVDEREQMVCGNVMTKGGGRRRCVKLSTLEREAMRVEELDLINITYEPAP